MYARIGALEAVAERLRDSDDIDPDEVFSE
jgi:hypothetical protein